MNAIFRNTWKIYAIGAGFLAALTGPASAQYKPLPTDPVPSVALQDYWATLTHLEAITLKISQAANGQCQNRWRHPGVQTHRLSDYPRSLRRSAAPFALQHPTIRHVPAPALQGKIGPGDVLTSTKGEPLDSHSLDLQIQLAFKTLTVNRAGTLEKIPYAPPLICYRPIRISPGLEPAARTQPDHIEISTGLLRAVRNDSELAFIIAHELSHFMLGHPQRLSHDRQTGNRSAKGRRALEREADRSAIYLLAKAGFDPQAAADFIQRSSILRDIPLLGLSSHDTRSRRLNLVNQAIADLRALPVADRDALTAASFVAFGNRP